MENSMRLLSIALVSLAITETRAEGPVPIGTSDVTFSYMTASGVRVLEGSFDYEGTGPSDALPLGEDPNLLYFNSANVFGRRIALGEDGLRADESLLAHAFFKPDGHADGFFADIIEDGEVTLDVQNIQFAEPVEFHPDTVMMHKLWDADQVDQLPEFYINVHNHETQTDPFRDFDAFFPLIFTDFPIPNYALGTLSGDYAMEFFGDGTDTLGFRVTVPYSLLRNFEDVDQEVPPELPAPFGFLEPFHFHFELVVSAADESCDGDANGDGLVDPLDSGFVLARFGCSVGTGDPDCDTADMNSDGLVNPLDVGYILARFGTCS